MTRKGTPCKLKSEPGRTRCKFHGGMSTGPKTQDGKERIAEAQRKRWADWRATERSGGGQIPAGEDNPESPMISMPVPG